MTDHALIDRFRQARRDTGLAVMDGLHAVKHGLRFGAETLEMVSPDVDAALHLAAEVAPDIRPRLAEELAQVSEDDFRQLSPVPPDTGVIAIARRPPVSAADVLCAPTDAPVVLLENPRNPFNIGAAVRVAAAAGAAGLLVTGQQDPWHPAAIVAAAGLQFALPVARADGIPGPASARSSPLTRRASRCRGAAFRPARYWPSARSGTERARNCCPAPAAACPSP